MDILCYMDRQGRGFSMIYREIKQLNKELSVCELGEEQRVVLSLMNDFKQNGVS